MMRTLNRRGRLSITLMVVSGCICIYALRGTRSPLLTFGIAVGSCLGAVLTAVVVDEVAWRRRSNRSYQ